MVKPLFDTNILIDYLLNFEEARAEIGRYARGAISVISWMEVMSGTRPETEDGTRRFLDRFERIDIDAGIAERAAEIRRQRRIKLPDAVIWASAIEQQLLLVSRNSKDFPADDPAIRIPYRL